MHIAYLNPTGNMGGAETSLLALLSGVREAEPDWRLSLLLGGDGPLRHKAAALGVEVQVVPFPQTFVRVGDSSGQTAVLFKNLILAALPTLLYSRKLTTVIRKLEPDVIHTNGFKMHVLGVWTKPQNVPLLWHIHDYVRSRAVVSKVLAWHSRWCTHVIANSRSVAQDLKLALRDRVQTSTIYNAVDLSRFFPNGPSIDLDERSGIPVIVGVCRVGLVATYARWKGHKTFLEALSLLPANLPFRGYIIGGPIYGTVGSQFSLEELRSEVERLGLEGKVGLTGFVDDVASAIRALDIVIHASTNPEPFGMAIVEGMACGKPVIAASAGGALEAFDDKKTALGHKAGSASELAERIQQLAVDADMRARLAEAGLSSCRQKFTQSRLAAELVPLYLKLTRLYASSDMLSPAPL